MAAQRANTVIAGVNKSGTTSLFTSLQAHPQVATSSVKETRYFLPARYGRPLEPVSVYESYFARTDNRPIRLEATPAYFYGGTRLVERLADVCGPEVRVVLAFREPVGRLVSFFAFQKTRLRLPEEMSLEEYLAAADRLDDGDFLEPSNERYFGFRGGCYADFLPAWSEALGERLRVVFFDDLLREPRAVLYGLTRWLGLDPAQFPDDELSSENRTIAFRSRGLQRVALAANDRLERFLRRHPALKRRLRGAYYRVNGRAALETVSGGVRDTLLERYREPNERLAAQLHALGAEALPDWLEPARPLRHAGQAGGP